MAPFDTKREGGRADNQGAARPKAPGRRTRTGEVARGGAAGTAAGAEQGAAGAEGAGPAGPAGPAATGAHAGEDEEHEGHEAEGEEAGGEESAALEAAGPAGAAAGAPEGGGEKDEKAEKGGSAGDVANVQIQRSAVQAGSLEGMHAQTAVDSVKGSAGSALPDSTRSRMEGSFGSSFADVRVHSGSESAAAAKDLNANAFTVGNDIHFGAGKYDPGSSSGDRLIAHELTHVAQGGGAAAHGTGSGATVSDPGDASEHAAEHAADAVMRGEKVGDIGGSPATIIHRDALGDLDTASQAAAVNAAALLTSVQNLNAADRRTLATNAARAAMLNRIVLAFNATQMIELFRVLSFDMISKIRMLNATADVGNLSVPQWYELMGTATPAHMAALRGDATHFRLFLQNAPREVIAPWDKFEGLVSGAWTPANANDELDRTVNNLSAAQKTTLRGRQDMVNAIRTRVSGPIFFHILTNLNFDLKALVGQLNTAAAIPTVTREQWIQLLTEASKAEQDALVADAVLWPLVSARVPPELLQIIRQNTTDPAGFLRALDDDIQVNSLMSSLGSVGMLAMMTNHGVDLRQAYAKLNGKSKIDPIIDGLGSGRHLGEDTTANLRRLFFLPQMNDLGLASKMVNHRFHITVSDGTNAPATSRAGIGLFTVAGLKQCWEVLERLPPEHVEGNRSFVNLLHRTTADSGNAAYGGRDNTVTLGYKNNGQLNDRDDTSVYNGTRMPVFNSALRHEIGHAVDKELSVTDNNRGLAGWGNWQNHGSPAGWVAALVAASGGIGNHRYHAVDQTMYVAAMTNTVANGTTFQVELDAIKTATPVAGMQPVGTAAPTTGPVKAVLTDGNYTDPAAGGNGPWYATRNWPIYGNRRFVQSYKGDNTELWSFDNNIRTAQYVTDYQWRSPGEWFAEVYQVYYAEQESSPTAPCGGRLRAHAPDAANFIANVIDHGHSPQARAGGGRPRAETAAPGT